MTANNLAGILNINKPGGLTSHDVVRQVRKIIGIKKVGHTGTLDPMATGVLLVCVGQATRLVEYMMASQKIYEATLKFGETTNTYDAEGKLIASQDPNDLTVARLNQILPHFQGHIQQVPPAFSAIKKNGIPLYKLARQGIEVNLTPRQVYIKEIQLTTFNLPEAKIRVICHAGTYIRSLAHDIGQKLGVGAHLTKLTRVQNGPWSLQDAITLQTLTQAAVEKNLTTVLHPLTCALTHLPHLTLSGEDAWRVSQGQLITLPEIDFNAVAEDVIVAYDQTGDLVALLTPVEASSLKPKKVFKTIQN